MAGCANSLLCCLTCRRSSIDSMAWMVQANSAHTVVRCFQTSKMLSMPNQPPNGCFTSWILPPCCICWGASWHLYLQLGVQWFSECASAAPSACC